MRGPENKVLRGIFRCKKQEVRGERRKFHNAERLQCSLLFTKYCQNDPFTEEMSRVN
jgi:hypothetical protein